MKPCLPALPAALTLLCAPLAYAAEPLTVTAEPLLFTGDTKAAATATLLHVPEAAPEIKSGDGSLTFTPGRDFTWEPGSRIVTLTADSRIPSMTAAQLHPAPNSPQAYASQRGTTAWMFYGPGRILHDLQAKATYRSADDWSPPRAAPASDEQLGPFRAKLRAHPPVTVVVLGDSISTGLDASALSQAEPRQPGYPDLVAAALQTRCGSPVALHNLAVSGMDAAWGLTQIPAVLTHQPDLLLLAFGMNDASGKRTPDEFARLSQEIVQRVRTAQPKCSAILVSSMTANAEWIHSAPDLYPAYARALASLSGPSVAFADVTATWSAVEQRKKFLDLSGNGLNHPNDYGHRLYADAILQVIAVP